MVKQSQKARIEELVNQRAKLAKDLVEFAIEWKKLLPGLSINSGALNNFVVLETMAEIILKTFTREEGNEEKDK